MTQRILFFGMEGVFSRAPLLELVNSHYEICALIVPRPEQSQPAQETIRRLTRPPSFKGNRIGDRDVPVLNEPPDRNIIGIAWSADIDVYEVTSLRSDPAKTLQQLRPDVVVVACFPFLLPNNFVSQYPSLNLHPSLLPAYRGPAPLFWIFHDGLEHAGVTIHLMDEHADTGDIVAQERVLLPDGIGYTEAERIVSEHAARQLLGVLDNAQTGSFAHLPQPRTSAPHAPNPIARDFVILPEEWTARRAYNFVRGIAEWNQPVIIQTGHKALTVSQAIAYDADEVTDTPSSRTSEGWKIRCARGTVTIRTTE